MVLAEGFDSPLAHRAAGAAARTVEVDADTMRRTSDTTTPQGILAVCREFPLPLEGAREADPLVVCVDVRDPGNLGAILRSAGAAGIGAVLCCEGTVDVHNPKCLRASAGAVFRLPVVHGGSPVEVLETVGSWEVNRLAATATGGTPYDACDLTVPTALVFGNERHGLDDAVLRHVDGRATIPMAPTAESLNVAMAATVLCFEAARQRRA